MSWVEKIFRFREPDETAVKPFLEHLEDLRWTVIKMGVTLCLAMGGSFFFRTSLVRIVQQPLLAVDPKLVNTLRAQGVADSITISFQLAFYAGLILAFPLLLYFLAEFILPALTAAEKKYMLPVVFISLGLFLTGVFFCYYGLLPQTLEFMYNDARKLQWNPEWTVEKYYAFTTQFVLAFGLAFELPVVVLLLVKLGILDHAMLARTRAIAFTLIFIFASILTPTTDVFTLCAMGFPMYFLYEICIWIAKWMEPKPSKQEGHEKTSS
ncbi:MAG TPA: twin-arginine translocase subunit TatC [Chthoniobacterales bacterium]